MRRASLLAVLAAMLVLAPGAAARGRLPVVAYWDAYSALDGSYVPRDLPAGRIDVLDVDLAYPTADGRCGTDPWLEHGMPFGAAKSVDGRADPAGAGRLRGVFGQLRKLKRLHRRLRVMVTVAELDPARDFARAARSPASRTRFVRSCVRRFVGGRFPGLRRAYGGIVDGIDLDWEVPHGAAARRSFTLLARGFRRALDAVRPGLLLTAAISAGADTPGSFDLRRAARSLSFVNVMGYDLYGAWAGVATFHAPLRADARVPSDRQTVARGIAMFERAGVPAGKLMLGVPFFGVAYRGVPPGPRGDGIMQPTTGGGGEIPYRELAATYASRLAVRHDARAAEAWVYDSAARLLIAYDDPAALRAKGAYARSHGLGGVMLWEISQDERDGTLLRALRTGLRPARRAAAGR